MPPPASMRLSPRNWTVAPFCDTRRTRERGCRVIILTRRLIFLRANAPLLPGRIPAPPCRELIIVPRPRLGSNLKPAKEAFHVVKFRQGPP